jgi:hypothetical protein
MQLTPYLLIFTPLPLLSDCNLQSLLFPPPHLTSGPPFLLSFSALDSPLASHMAVQNAGVGGQGLQSSLVAVGH